MAILLFFLAGCLIEDHTFARGPVQSEACAEEGSTCSGDGSYCFEGTCGGDRASVLAEGCAVLQSGSLWCWGDNLAPTLVEIAIPDGVFHVSRTFGGHTCAVTGAGKVWCWGNNGHGELGHSPDLDDTCDTGDGTQIPCSPEPRQVEGLPVSDAEADPVAEVATGNMFTCARTLGGAVYCWGDNEWGQLGTGAPRRPSWRWQPAVVDGMEHGVLSVKTSETWSKYACAIKADTSVWCWGRNSYGELGSPPVANPACEQNACTSSPTEIGIDDVGQRVTSVVDIAIGYLFTCARTYSGAVLCWGFSAHGILGRTYTNTQTQSHPQPTHVPGLPPLVRIESREYHACGLTGDGEVWCWGVNNSGQLGTGALSTEICDNLLCSPEPVRANIANAVDVHTWMETTYALDRDGVVWAWGNNSYSGLGHTAGTMDDQICRSGDRVWECNPKPTPIAFAQPPE